MMLSKEPLALRLFIRERPVRPARLVALSALFIALRIVRSLEAISRFGSKVSNSYADYRGKAYTIAGDDRTGIFVAF